MATWPKRGGDGFGEGEEENVNVNVNVKAHERHGRVGLLRPDA
jgi:hypothetical protein